MFVGFTNTCEHWGNLGQLPSLTVQAFVSLGVTAHFLCLLFCFNHSFIIRWQHSLGYDVCI